jgi:hypothetical protein
MITIKQVDIQLDIEGTGDEATFEKYFEKHWNRARRIEEESLQRRRLAAADRRLGDRPGAQP